MFGKIKNFVQLTSIIFTILILMEVVGGIKTDNQIVLAMLTCSLAASLLKLCFFPEVLFEYSPLRQTVYLRIFRWFISGRNPSSLQICMGV